MLELKVLQLAEFAMVSRCDAHAAAAAASHFNVFILRKNALHKFI